MIVIDASAMVELLLNTAPGAWVRRQLTLPSHAPHLLDVEVAQVLRRFVRKRFLSRDRAETAIRDLRAFPLRRHPHDVLLTRVLELSDNLTAYDACYIALAEALGASLVTCDSKLSNVPGSTVAVLLPQ